MRSLLLALVLLAPVQAQFTKTDRDQLQKADEKNGDVHENAWKDYVATLKQGAVYQAEIVHRADDGELYYYRVLFGPKAPRPEMFGLGVNAKGECVPPPDPGYQRLLAARDVVVKVGDKIPPQPIAFPTHYLDVELKTEDTTTAQIRTSDLATSMPLPAKPGAVTSVYFNGLFRLERLTDKQIENAEPLRQDAKALQARLAELRKEALADKENFDSDTRRLALAATVWREEKFTNAVREHLTAWMDQPRDKTAGKGFPNDLAYALGNAGNKDDFTLFRKLGQQQPDYGSYVNYPAMMLLKRTTGPDAVPLFRVLLQDAAMTQGDNKNMRLLRGLDKTIPEYTSGDDHLQTLIRMFDLKPENFNLSNVAGQLLLFRDRLKLERNELQYLKDASMNGAGEWMFLTKKDRTRGVEAALKWIGERK